MLNGLLEFFYSSAVAIGQIDGPNPLQHSFHLLQQSSTVSLLHLSSRCLI